MKELNITTHSEVDTIFNNYPESVRDKMYALRNLVIETAKASEDVTAIEETLKWGEPSFVTKHGSTLRMDWKERSPDQYAMYFQCTSRLVETFKMTFPHLLEFEGKRAIIFQLDQNIPKEALKQCINAALNYHKVKHLPTLGI